MRVNNYQGARNYHRRSLSDLNAKGFSIKILNGQLNSANLLEN